MHCLEEGQAQLTPKASRPVITHKPPLVVTTKLVHSSPSMMADKPDYRPLTSSGAVSRSDVSKLYDDYRRHYGPYHNHKENCGWAALIGHIAFCGMMVSMVVKATTPATSQPVFNGILIGSMTIECLLVLIYMHWQSMMKNFAANVIAATFFLQAGVLYDPNPTEDYSQHLKVLRSGDPNLQCQHVLPQMLLQEANIAQGHGGLAQLATRVLAQGLVVFSALAVVVYKWLL